MKKTLDEMIVGFNKILNSLQQKYDNVYFDVELHHDNNGRYIKVTNSVNNLDLPKHLKRYGFKQEISHCQVHDFQSDFDIRIDEICQMLKKTNISYSEIMAF